MSLADVSAATNISVEILKAIDAGKTDILPQAYVRAFLREYASAVGLNPANIMEQYDPSGKEKREEKKAQQNKPPDVRPVPEPAGNGSSKSGPGPATIAVIVAVAAIVAVLYWNLSDHSADLMPEQTPMTEFDAPPETARPVGKDTTAVAKQSTDSLVLRAATSDTVWVLLIIDSADSLEYLLSPGANRSWKASSSFRISVGRPEAIELSLNGIPIRTLSNGKRIIRDSLIDRSTLAKLQKQE